MEIKKQRVISLCDGLSGGYLAFKELGVPVEYHAVEIDSHARKLSDHNLPDIIRWQNDVTKVTKEDIEFYGPFDWVTFGSPCQSLSVSGNGTGLLGKSGILFNCVQILDWAREFNPEVKFLVENVKMKKEFLHQFDMVLGSDERILINASLVSAQKRERYYWTNFKVEQPEDTGEFLYSILEKDVPESMFLQPKNIHRITESRICWDTPNKGGKESQQDRAYNVESKGPSIPSSRVDNKTQIYQFVNKDKSYCIDASYHKGTTLRQYMEKSRRQVVLAYSSSTRENKRIESRVNLSGKSNTLTTGDGCTGGLKTAIYGGDFLDQEIVFRKLTVRECARLQKIPEWYDFSPVSKTQGYKAIGNGWCIAVIVHILKHGLGLLKAEEKGEDLL